MLLQGNPIGDALNNTEWAFPLAECFHITAFALSIGTIVVVDLRLLGIAMKRQTAARLIKDTDIWAAIGLVVVIFSGLALFVSDPGMYLANPSFRFKVEMLVVAILFNYTIHRRVAMSDSPSMGKLVAIVSLLLWISVVFGGLFIAFV